MGFCLICLALGKTTVEFVYDKPLMEANNLITSLYTFSMATDSILEWTSDHPAHLYSTITLGKILYNCTNMTFLWNGKPFY